ncbi:MAG TPA: hypothetical protein PLA54_14845, partial [Spirochaetota bacterium]|nr:hypothetical protein [Spirochaetota bacterium]
STISKNLYFGVGSSDHPYIVKTNENISNLISSLNQSSIKYSFFNYKNKDHYTVCRSVFIDGLLMYYGINNKTITGISDIKYQHKKYSFQNPAELYDWSILNSKPDDAAKKISIIKDSSSNNNALIITNIFNNGSSTGSAITVFDHFENFKGKTLTADFFVPGNKTGIYKVAMRLQSTYSWILDESKFVILDKTGWQKLSFNIDDSAKNGNSELLRSIGFSIRETSPDTKAQNDILISNISWK